MKKEIGLELKLLHHWRIITAMALFIIGGFLVFPAARLLPVVTNLAFVKLSQKENELNQFPISLPTPFQPFQSYQLFLPIIDQNIDPENSDQFSIVNYKIFEEIDFSPGSLRVTIRILPEDSLLSSGKPVEISFLPGGECIFGDGQGCVYTFSASTGRQVIFTSVHSGVGGEGEKFRSVIEGTGINQGLYTTVQVNHNAQMITGAGISLLQGSVEITGLELIAVARIPPQHLGAYMTLPVEKTLDFAVAIGVLNPAILVQDLLVFETCGWRLPGETEVSGFGDTTGSVYLGVVRIAN
ncbi:MAG: hypothetical protein IBX69_00220 [Anaerolineales bacterium]|nr:hypothetical protein [Anaerolineales bacterium]